MFFNAACGAIYALLLSFLLSQLSLSFEPYHTSQLAWLWKPQELSRKFNGSFETVGQLGSLLVSNSIINR
jgi:hypothetical protein